MDAQKQEFVVTNISTYLAIAKEAFDQSEKIGAAQRSPREGGGDVITFDPDQKSFKHALVAIVFAGVYLEAYLYLVGCRLLGKTAYDRIDRKPYEEKLRALGVEDEALLTAAKEFRAVRKELVHEKAYESTELRTAQEEAKKAIAFIERVRVAVRDRSRSGNAAPPNEP